MSFFGFGPSKIPFDMFDLARNAREARRADKLANIYHRGQDLAWNGREVLAALMKKHGGIHIDEDKREALGRLYSLLMWGELAAWKVSAELADRLVPLEAKMAATSQVHDEARHFYVLHDYLSALGCLKTRIDRPARALLDFVLEDDDLCHKLMGMQLLIETIALTIFQAVRESKVEPVLCELMLYYEKDEARHVGLGLQFLPQMLREMPRWRALRLLWTEVRLMGLAMGELKMMEGPLRKIGVDARRIFSLGMAKQAIAFQALWAEVGADPGRADELGNRLLTTLGDVMFPSEAQRQGGPRARLRAALATFRGGIPDMPASSLDPEGRPLRPEVPWSRDASAQ